MLITCKELHWARKHTPFFGLLFNALAGVLQYWWVLSTFCFRLQLTEQKTQTKRRKDWDKADQGSKTHVEAFL